MIQPVKIDKNQTDNLFSQYENKKATNKSKIIDKSIRCIGGIL